MKRDQFPNPAIFNIEIIGGFSCSSIFCRDSIAKVVETI